MLIQQNLIYFSHKTKLIVLTLFDWILGITIYNWSDIECFIHIDNALRLDLCSQIIFSMWSGWAVMKKSIFRPKYVLSVDWKFCTGILSIWWWVSRYDIRYWHLPSPTPSLYWVEKLRVYQPALATKNNINIYFLKSLTCIINLVPKGEIWHGRCISFLNIRHELKFDNLHTMQVGESAVTSESITSVTNSRISRKAAAAAAQDVQWKAAAI